MKSFIRRLSAAPLQISMVVLVASLVITQSIAYKITIAEKSNEQLLVEKEALQIKTTLEESLSHSVTATRMLAYLMQNDLVEENFVTISQELADQNAFIDALQYVVGNTIIDTYPREGHEPTIGYAVLEQRPHRQQAMLALERGDLYFEGPFELLQGGLGVVGRYPVMIEGDLYGFSAVVIRLETIHNALSLNPSGVSERFVYQIMKESEADSVHFFQNTELFDSGLVHTEFVPFGNWNLMVKLTNASYFRNGLLFSSIGILFSGLLAFIVGYLAREPRRLQSLVDERTKDLENSKLQLQDYNNKLIRSNRELEQFAYITSHDLQEPLRMISSFLNQLKRKYGDSLDEKAHTYIYFAMNGAENMRQIILDLLDYSIVGQHSDQRTDVNISKLIESVKIHLKKTIEEHEATVTHGEMPVLYGSENELRVLFQNLISNAVRFRHPDRKPAVTITSTETDMFWEFEINDNGIGIDAEYTEKIFQIFQRLHNREEYKGTGMGLAICKKIVEEHGGTIWVESDAGTGSTFYFTLAKVNTSE